MKSILWAGLLCLVWFNSDAQNAIKGRVIESNGIEVLGAIVELEETEEQVTTDENGWFELKSSQPFPWNLNITYPGFSQQTLNIKKEKEVQIVMWEWSRLGKQEVTAQKRTEDQKEVPNFITIRQGEEILFKGQNRLDESSAHTPGIFIIGGYAAPSLNVGGIGTSPGNLGFEQSIATFVDGIYFGKAQQAIGELLDVERIEILSGPQGLFFGQSSIGGAINITNNVPENCNEGYINFFGGSQDEYGGEAAYTIVFDPKFRVRVAGLYKTFGGMFEDDYTNEQVGGSEAYTGRITAIYEPSDKFQLKIKGQYGKSSFKGSQLQRITSDSARQVWKPASGLPTFFQGQEIAKNDSTYNPNIQEDNILGQGGALPLPASAPGFFERGVEQIGWLDDIGTDQGTYNFSISGDYKMEQGNIFAQAGYSSYNWDQMLDFDMSKYFLYHNQGYQDYNQISGELRYASTKKKRMNYQAGVYYQKDQLNADNNILTPIKQHEYFIYDFNGNILTDSLGRAVAHPLYHLGVQFAGAQRGVRFEQDASRASAFGHLSYKISPKILVTIGGRITNELKVGNAYTISSYSAEEMALGMVPTRDTWEVVDDLPEAMAPDLVNNLVPVEAPRLENMRLSETTVNPSINVNYSSDKLTVYAKFSQGWKSGGFNLANTIPVVNSEGFNDVDEDGIPDEATFRPEKSNAFELGLKGRWLTPKGGVLNNISLYYNNYDQLQVNTFNPATGAFTASNAGKARKFGLLLEGKLLVNSYFSIGYNGSILDAKYLDYRGAACNGRETQETIANGGTGPCEFSSINPITGQQTFTVNRTGYSLKFAPTYYVTVSPNFNIPIGRSGFRINLGADVSYRDDYDISDNYDESGSQEAFLLADAWLGFAMKERWFISFYGRNLTNEAYLSISNNAVLGYARDFRYGAQIRYNIGGCEKETNGEGQNKIRL